MRTCFKNNALALAFLCISICSPPAFAATTLPPTSKQAAETKIQPTIHMKEPDYNFGEIMEGTTEVQHDFIVSNTGKEVLRIESVRVG